MIPVIMHSGTMDGLGFWQFPTLRQEAREGWGTRFGREISWF